MATLDSLDDALTEDHVQLDELFRSLRREVDLRDPSAESARSEFERRLLRHMTWEEELLFPSLRAAQSSYPEKKIESLVIDHARIREKLQEKLESVLIAVGGEVLKVVVRRLRPRTALSLAAPPVGGVEDRPAIATAG